MVRELLVKVEPLGWRVTGFAARLFRRVELAWGRAELRAVLGGEPTTPGALAREADVFRRLRESRRRDPSG